ncbi:MAG: sulfotransferase domain-containing protein [Lentisphaerae bacterium]|nr:sulfotransferase domain-containing protein [Lentisphaerota bacterium]
MSTTRPIVEIVSSEAPCGVTFLLNALVELDVLIFAGEFDVFWRLDGQAAHPNPILQKKFSVWIPSLKERAEFPVRDDTAFYWTHGWPYPQDPARKRILFVRDPRDALYSYYRRLALSTPLNEFLEAPTPPLGTRLLERWALQKLLWQALAIPEQFLLVRFEDIKAQPLEVIRRILAFAGIQRDDDRILHAVAQSQTDRVKKLHDQSLSAVATKRTEIRKGQSYEWKTAPGRADLPLYRRGYILRALHAFGYEVEPAATPAVPAADTTDDKAQGAALAHCWYRRLYGRTLGDNTAATERIMQTLVQCISESRTNACIATQLQTGAGGLTVPTTGRQPAPRGARWISYRTHLVWRMWIFCRLVRITTTIRALSLKLCPGLAQWIDKRVLAFELGRG